MECNKEEALKAKTIAENKLAQGDFTGAQKMARKAQQLYPTVDNISQLLAVCDVHCAAEKKLAGTEKNWYAILQVEQFADDAVIKKQYRKLALLLHPDKNKINGAEAAFKLIGEANHVLTDHNVRLSYDMKVKNSATYTQVVPTPHHQSNGGSSVMNPHGNFPIAPRNSAPHNFFQSLFKPPQFNSREKRQTFWTCCHNCGARYEYYMTFMNVALRCQTCNKDYITHNVGPAVEKPASSQQDGIPDQIDLSALNIGKKRRKKSEAESSGNSQAKKSRVMKAKKAKAATSGLTDERVEVAPVDKFDYPDSEFNDFEKDRAEMCFAAGQVWALFDNNDGMPRFYARVDGIISPGFKLSFTWLDPSPADVALRNVPLTCGRFVEGDSEETENRLMFSHQMRFTRDPEGTYIIHPRKEETWALYKKSWDTKRYRYSENSKMKCEFEYVVVSSDYNADVGIEVSHLKKVDGYAYLFQEAGLEETVLSSELVRFSHRIPSAKMSGEEKDDVPAGSFELDPASLSNIEELCPPAALKKEKKKPPQKTAMNPPPPVMKPIVLGLAARNGPQKHLIMKSRN